MKFLITLFIFPLFNLSAIAQDFTLTVTNGSASGNYYYGDTIHVFSDNAPGAGVFTEWTGSGENYLSIPDEWHTILVVPSGSGVDNLSIEAHYDQLPEGAAQTTEMISLFGMQGGIFTEDVMKEVNFSIPENPKGIVFLFHGTGGRGSSMYSKYEVFSLIKDFYYAGYGCIATDANERTVGDQNGDGKIRWLAGQPFNQEPTNNVDLLNIQALKDTFITRYGLPADFPFFSYGVSNGANFSDLAAAALDFTASAHNTGNGNAQLYLYREDATPVIWLQAVNDNNSNANPEVALANYQTLIDRNICTEWQWLNFSPLYEKRFMRSRNNINEQKSLEIFNRFFDYPGLVDDDNFLTISNLLDMPSDFYDPLGLTQDQQMDVKSQLKVVNADHGSHGDYNKTLIRFFENLCLTTSLGSFPGFQVEINIFPNPAKNFLNIKINNAKPESVELFGAEGKVVLKKDFSESTGEIILNVRILPRGIYFLRIKSDYGMTGKKIVLE